MEELTALCEWRSMDSAPKDGSTVMLLCSRNECICIGAYFDPDRLGKANWYSWFQCLRWYGVLIPVGWRPLFF